MTNLRIYRMFGNEFVHRHCVVWYHFNAKT